MTDTTDEELETRACPHCNGYGENAWGRLCTKCDGSGTLKVEPEPNDDEGDWWENGDDF